MSVDSRYIRIATKFWQDEKARRLSDDAKLLYLYVLTSPHSNMAGYYVLPKPYVAYDLKWLPERLDKAFNELLHQGVIKYCETSDVVLIPNFFKYNPIQNRNQAVGVAKRVSELPANTLQKDFLAAVKRFAQPFLELFAERLTEWFGNTETDTDTETDTESESATEAAAELKPDDDDDDVKHFVSEVTKEFAVAFGYPPNQTQMEMLMSFTNDGMAGELILEALKRSAQNGARGPTYTKAILQSWLNKGALTMVDVERLDGVLSRQTPSNRTGETAAERLLREEIKREQAEANIIDVIDVAWSEGG